ncbi:hypothetical protein CTheo_8903 [Ceratobasidium theobromae]|uniref:Tc1-like transposase DDE domain-containing protein n=1 Tax=Ceratobasidium theobromae TaxID=1582974 RepID=A0A5N5Q8D6_9AGAM|nr:hypothetical protein CTheo_8903 [Ceratobasidium theobromae]
MGRKNSKGLAKVKQLVANREKRWAKPPSDIDPPSPSSAALPNPVTLFRELSIAKHPLPSQGNIDQPVNPTSNNSPEAIEPTEPNCPIGGTDDPESDLLFEDPESDPGGLEDDMADDNGWWEENIPDDEESDEENMDPNSYKGQGKTRRSTFDEVTLSRIRLMLMSLRLSRALGCGLIKGTSLAAAAVGQAKWAACSTHQWIHEFWRTNTLPANLQGIWNHSIIEDKDLKTAIQEHLHWIGRYASPKDVINFFSTPEAGPFTHLLDKPLSIHTAQHWMLILRYTWKTERWGQFADGHEWEDVVDFRMNNFIPKWIPPELKEGKKECVAHFHDETIYHAHDRWMTRWIRDGETAGLYKKGEGISLMVADIVSAKYGFLQRPGQMQDQNGNKLSDLITCIQQNLLSATWAHSGARVLFKPGKERDGYFCNDHVCKQLEEAIQIVKEQYLNEEHVFIFDNTMTHMKLPDTAPIVNWMTLGPSHKVKGETTSPSREKIKVNFAAGRFSDGSCQEFYYPTNHPKVELQGTFKGLTKILEERGIPGAHKLKLQCPTTNGQTGCPPGKKDCCARRTMANQPDILEQKTILQLLAESHDCSVIYLPKYHCELNPIEQCWGAAKRVYRDNPMSSTETDLIHNTLVSLDSVKLESI